MLRKDREQASSLALRQRNDQKATRGKTDQQCNIWHVSVARMVAGDFFLVPRRMHRSAADLARKSAYA